MVTPEADTPDMALAMPSHTAPPPVTLMADSDQSANMQSPRTATAPGKVGSTSPFWKRNPV
jgi:hypothetical protein